MELGKRVVGQPRFAIYDIWCRVQVGDSAVGKGLMTKWGTIFLAAGGMLASGLLSHADQPAKVTGAVNDVEHGLRAAVTTPAQIGSTIREGEYLKTGIKSRAELLLPTTSITRLGSNTIFNYSVESNTIDLQSGTILFCKPKNAEQLNIKTAAVLAGIVGTTGFVSVQGEGKTTPKIFRLGIVEGHARATANGRTFSLGAGDILEVRGGRPFTFAFDVPRFVRSSPLLHSFKSRLPNQSYIDAEIDRYQEEASRGFIQSPSNAIDYSGDIPVLPTTAYDSASNAQVPKGSPPPPPPQTPGR